METSVPNYRGWRSLGHKVDLRCSLTQGLQEWGMGTCSLCDPFALFESSQYSEIYVAKKYLNAIQQLILMCESLQNASTIGTDIWGHVYNKLKRDGSLQTSFKMTLTLRSWWELEWPFPHEADLSWQYRFNNYSLLAGSGTTKGWEKQQKVENRLGSYLPKHKQWLWQEQLVGNFLIISFLLYNIIPLMVLGFVFQWALLFL